MGDWADAFHRQAEEDFRALMSMDQRGAPSTCCMLMQMVFEKLAKAKFAKETGQQPPHNHDIIRYILARLHNDPRYGKEIVLNDSVKQFATELEIAHPSVVNNDKNAGKNAPRLEYPWEDINRQVLCPADDLPIAKRISDLCDPIMEEVLDFLDMFIKFTP